MNHSSYFVRIGCWCTNISTMEFRIMASRSYALPWISYLEGLDKGSSWDNNGALELMNAYVVAVLDELTALYLHIDVVLKKKDQLDQRGARSVFHHLYYTT
ncbi:hypothetical protein HanRHA438_Chr02g0084241 [Helianthus annuus]|nr:hypothetical protein HanHA300_Chr02g0060601 [Helianthus annuus]KAJ0615965.1 hypothetical protein HanIR_Chr02g0085231 [Helianthus annuus]KAJ0619240.1 hypothetical protein HanHA89_Chr02g0069141 [Helianthus annuus]KAJ0777693.1 hypothetical protein HanLR1_Chr02g0063381 [Helianthus annuus]KAJ0786714.1 hypothetical protein HanOQP8_Chr02g0074411 [Helianthus annuus]